MSQKQRYYVRVCRPRFEVAVVELDAPNIRYAKINAAIIASELPDSAWAMLPHDNERYFPHVEDAATEADMEAGVNEEQSKDSLIAEFRDVKQDQSKEYLLLMGDVEAGEGELIAEPWCQFRAPETLELDLAGDWVKRIHDVFFEGDPIWQPWLDIVSVDDLSSPPELMVVKPDE